jgi:hypothetical protein
MMKRLAIAISAVMLIAAASCGSGNKNAEEPRKDLKPFKEVSATEIFEQVLSEKGYTSKRDVQVWIVGHGPIKVDLWVEEIPLVIEYLNAEDRAAIGQALKSSKVGDQFKLVAVATEEIGENEQLNSSNSRYCVVFDDRDYVYQPNPTSEDRYEITIFEIKERIRKDAIDVIEELSRILEGMSDDEDEDEDDDDD